jgi:hypothetical protein
MEVSDQLHAPATLPPGERTSEGKMFGPKDEEIMGDKRKLSNYELYNLYSS